MAKFKVGDKVKVVKRAKRSMAPGKEKHIGQIFQITGVCERDSFPYTFTNVNYAWCDEELAYVEFTKADLKDGMVVEIKERTLSEKYFLVLGDVLLGRRGSLDINRYNDDLTRMNGEDNLDIIKVYKTNAKFLGKIISEEHLEVIWERPKEEPVKEMTIEEIEQVLGHKVKVIGKEGQ